MAMTKQQYEYYHGIDKKRDNYPKYLHIDIKNNNKHIKPSAICTYNGKYIRLYDNDNDKYYYYNDTQQRIATLRTNNAQLESSNKSLEVKIVAMENNIKKQNANAPKAFFPLSLIFSFCLKPPLVFK